MYKDLKYVNITMQIKEIGHLIFVKQTMTCIIIMNVTIISNITTYAIQDCSIINKIFNIFLYQYVSVCSCVLFHLVFDVCGDCILCVL